MAPLHRHTGTSSLDASRPASCCASLAKTASPRLPSEPTRRKVPNQATHSTTATAVTWSGDQPALCAAGRFASSGPRSRRTHSHTHRSGASQDKCREEEEASTTGAAGRCPWCGGGRLSALWGDVAGTPHAPGQRVCCSVQRDSAAVLAARLSPTGNQMHTPPGDRLPRRRALCHVVPNASSHRAPIRIASTATRSNRTTSTCSSCRTGGRTARRSGSPSSSSATTASTSCPPRCAAARCWWSSGRSRRGVAVLVRALAGVGTGGTTGAKQDGEQHSSRQQQAANDERRACPGGLPRLPAKAATSGWGAGALHCY